MIDIALLVKYAHIYHIGVCCVCFLSAKIAKESICQCVPWYLRIPLYTPIYPYRPPCIPMNNHNLHVPDYTPPTVRPFTHPLGTPPLEHA